MVEEGPEAHEMLEQAEQQQHAVGHGEHAVDKAKRAFTMRSAITASALAVAAALGSLLSGHAANEAILKQSKASDQWAYYQAKSTKSHIFEGSKAVIEALASEEGKDASPAVTKALKGFDKKIEKYEEEKNEIQKEAGGIEKESALLFEKHQSYSFGVACFQIGIVLASVGIMVTNRYLFYGSIGAGLVGIAYLVVGYMK